jgi:hypothetical protein
LRKARSACLETPAADKPTCPTTAVETYPVDITRLWLPVFEDHHRARRFWEKQGWESTGRTSRTSFEPHPVLVEYELHLRKRVS